MARPQKTTFDALIDQFSDWTIDRQEKALELMQFEHRRAKIRAQREKQPNGQPESQPGPTLLDDQEGGAAQ